MYELKELVSYVEDVFGELEWNREPIKKKTKTNQVQT